MKSMRSISPFFTSGMWPTTVWNPSDSSAVRKRSTVSSLELNTAIVGLRPCSVAPGRSPGPALPRAVASQSSRFVRRTDQWPTSNHGGNCAEIIVPRRRCLAAPPAGPRSPGAPDHARDNGNQLGGVHRLRDVNVEACCQTPDPVLRSAERGQGHRRDLPASLGPESSYLVDERGGVILRLMDVGGEDSVEIRM